MRIKVVKTIKDKHGDRLPDHMIGKKYDVIKEDLKGVWVKESKLETYVYYEELEIIELSDKMVVLFRNYLNNKPLSDVKNVYKHLG